ncbi:MAG: ABC transporter permease, partial [Hungatella sp.]
MKINPVYRRETTVSTRSFRMALIILVFNSLLAVVALLNMYSVVSKVKVTAEIQYSSFLELYTFVATMEFGMLMFIIPALTAGSISGERERGTLELMLTTKMTPVQIVIGKLAASFSTIFLLIISSFPVLSLVFVYGGVTFSDICMLLLCYLVTAYLAGSVGICFSSIFKRSTIATAVSYGFLAALVAGSYAINVFALSIGRMNVDSYAQNIGSVAQQTSSGGILYLLLLNPATNFYITIQQQVGNYQKTNHITQWFGAREANLITE